MSAPAPSSVGQCYHGPYEDRQGLVPALHSQLVDPSHTDSTLARKVSSGLCLWAFAHALARKDFLPLQPRPGKFLPTLHSIPGSNTIFFEQP